MTKIAQLQLKAPAIRINNRAKYLHFFEDILGFKTIFEENADAGLGDQTDKIEKLLLVESPSMRTRAVEGEKVLARIVIRLAQPTEIENLLATGLKYDKVYQGPNGYAFEITSPQGDVFLLHAEDNIADLKELVNTDFKVSQFSPQISAFTVSQLDLRTLDLAATQDFYSQIFEDFSILRFSQSENIDFGTEDKLTWDIESLQLTVPADFDLTALSRELEKEHKVFLDRKARLMIVTDPNGVELWFHK